MSPCPSPTTPLSQRRAERVPVRTPASVVRSTPRRTPRRQNAITRTCHESDAYLYGHRAPQRLPSPSTPASPVRQLVWHEDDILSAPAIHPASEPRKRTERPVYGSMVQLTPVRASDAVRQRHGTEWVLSPVRHAHRAADEAPDTRALLQQTRWTYAPNVAIEETALCAVHSHPDDREARRRAWRHSLAQLRATAEAAMNRPASATPGGRIAIRSGL